MITFLAGLPVGNAVRCLQTPPEGADAWKVLRRNDANFTGYDDPNAIVVNDSGEAAFVDHPLANGTQVFYQAYAHVAGQWAADGDVVSVTPLTVGEDEGADVQELVRMRLEWGLKAEIAANRLKHDNGSIPTLSAPPIFEECIFPMATVHLAGQSPFIYGLGEIIAPPQYDAGTDLWNESEGRFNRISLTIVLWALNPDVRIKLRKAINRLLLGNLPIFDDAGLDLVEWSAQDTEDFQSYGVAMYQTVFTFSCIAAAAFAFTVSTVDDVEVDQAA